MPFYMPEPNVIEFTIPGRPKPKGNAKVVSKTPAGRWSIRNDAKVVARQEEMTWESLPFRPETPWWNPVLIEASFVFVPPASWRDKKREAALRGEVRHDDEPDLDNLYKMLKDALKGVFYVDDKQISNIVGAKVYGEVECTKVKLTALDQYWDEEEEAAEQKKAAEKIKRAQKKIAKGRRR